MSCCVRTTSLARAWSAGKSANAGAASGSSRLHPVPLGPVVFEYVGRTGLTVVGSQTNKRYRFDYPGAKVEIAAADVPSVAQVPTLRRVT